MGLHRSCVLICKTVRSLNPGIGINCSRPDVVSQFGKSAKAILPDLTLIAYPNSGEVFAWDGHYTFDQLKANPDKATEMNMESFYGKWVGKK